MTAIVVLKGYEEKAMEIISTAFSSNRFSYEFGTKLSFLFNLSSEKIQPV
ncbi:hypothetical protein H4683_002983 [Filibacter limicola]|uniref:Uncharacterized protein n=1 Tax=Sporosarcina limicola TaxID=34101 RepID=A0A927MJQ1_9BACL|nr:hypothetical protein [Sporosarcina limicola]